MQIVKFAKDDSFVLFFFWGEALSCERQFQLESRKNLSSLMFIDLFIFFLSEPSP